MQSFDELALRPQLMQALGDLNFTTPTPIQAQAIPAILKEEADIIALAQTGTGKTAAFSLPIIEQLDEESTHIQAIILCPTRELCLQVANDIKAYTKYMPEVEVVSVYGGASVTDQIKLLKKGCQIVVGTPGRTLDLINRKSLKINHVHFVVLDEADEMLNMGFQEDMDSILAHTPDTKQILLFSATMPDGVRKIADNYMSNPREISVGRRNEGAKNITHVYYAVRPNDRYEALKRLVDVAPSIYGIIFCRTRRETQEITDKLIAQGYNCDALHGDLSQAQRDSVMAKFRQKTLQLLVATDVAARGIDVDELTHVINYNLPDDPEVYVHRSGRTGRAGRTGVSYAIVTSKELRTIRTIEKMIGKSFEKGDVPSGKVIFEKRLMHWLNQFIGDPVNEKLVSEFGHIAYEQLAGLSKEDLINRLLSKQLAHFMSYGETDKDVNIIADERGDRGGERGERGDRRRADNFSKVHINIGAKHNLNAARLIGLINESLKNRSVQIGKIDIQRNFSFFEIDSAFEAKMITAMGTAKFNGMSISAEISKSNGQWGFAGNRNAKSTGFKGGSDFKKGNKPARKRNRFV